MLLIGITEELSCKGEVEAINMLFGNGLEILHIRKPTATQQGYKQFIQHIDEAYHPRLVLHEHYEYAETFGLQGIHLNMRNRKYKPKSERLTISRSCHSIKEIAECDRYDYMFLSPMYDSVSESGRSLDDIVEYVGCSYLFLSPIYDSVSKYEYYRKFTDEELAAAGRDGIINERIIALGGVTAECLPEIKQYGFGGAAVIGSLWGNFANDGDFDALLERFYKLKDKCDAL